MDTLRDSPRHRRAVPERDQPGEVLGERVAGGRGEHLRGAVAERIYAALRDLAVPEVAIEIDLFDRVGREEREAKDDGREYDQPEERTVLPGADGHPDGDEVTPEGDGEEREDREQRVVRAALFVQTLPAQRDAHVGERRDEGEKREDAERCPALATEWLADHDPRPFFRTPREP